MSAVKKASSRAVAKKGLKEPTDGARELAALFAREIPEIVAMEKFGNMSYVLDGKVVGFMRRTDSLVLKLPAERVRELVEQRGWQPLVMGKRTMKEWIVAECGPKGWRAEMKLLREAVEFVRESAASTS